MKFQTYDLSLFIGHSYFDYDGKQNYLIIAKRLIIKIIFQRRNLKGCLKKVLNPLTSNNSLVSSLNFSNNKIWLKFDGNCLKKEKIAYVHEEVVNIYIVYKINLWTYSPATKFTLGNSLFGAVKLTKYADLIRISIFGIGFDTRGSFHCLIIASLEEM